jgi:hypothetical protein
MTSDPARPTLLLTLACATLLGTLAYAAGPEAPVITAISPHVTFERAKVALQGSHLAAVTQVLFENKRPARFQVISDGELEVTVPDGAAMAGQVTVSGPAGGAVSAQTVFVAPGGN